MRRWARRLGLAAAILVALAALAVAAVRLVSQASLAKDYRLAGETVSHAVDAAAIARGERLGRGATKCVVCHGDDLGGLMLWDNRSLGRIGAPNITGGAGSVVGGFEMEDWERAIRHGVGRDGEPLLYMPADSYWLLSDEDLAAIVAWVRSMPPIDREIPAVRISLAGRWLYLRGRFPDLNHARRIRHRAQHPAAVEPGPTAEYGRYLVDISSCRLCHGADLAGHPDAEYSRNAPPLTPDSYFGTWSRDDFIAMMRTGVTPSGHRINEQYMVWDLVGELSDEELTAMYLYLKSRPPRVVAER
jgi:mono/diheme cytochrome c family protein